MVDQFMGYPDMSAPQEAPVCSCVVSLRAPPTLSMDQDPMSAPAPARPQQGQPPAPQVYL